MGQEIAKSRFTEDDFQGFQQRLETETRLFGECLKEGGLATGPARAGFELEAWLVDPRGRPAGIIAPFLEALDDPLVVPELATFNLELNGTPVPLGGTALTTLAEELECTWIHCREVAEDLGASVCMTGILPTLAPADLDLEHMAPRARYRALNEQVLRLRGGRPLRLRIQGREAIDLEQDNVMLEAAATAFQIHLMVAPAEAARLYNASKILSAPMVALAANSPYLFGRDLWDETRIPLFEQAVDAGGPPGAQRVGFGLGYAEDILDCFQANLDRYPILLPQLLDEPPERFAHLRLHNGTIWRWNRPLIGFDVDGRPHLRLEHRVTPSGPSIPDSLANAAFYFGLVRALADLPEPPEHRLPFVSARANFYAAARYGLKAEVEWFEGRRGTLAELVRDELLGLAAEGLNTLGLDPAEIDHWLGILRGRLHRGRTGAAWQRAWVARHGPDWRGLVEAGLGGLDRCCPVHQWPV